MTLVSSLCSMHRGNALKSLVLSLFIVSAFISGVGEAKAISFTIPPYPEIFTVSAGDYTYTPGEVVTVSGSVTENICANTTPHARILVDNVVLLDEDLLNNGTMYGSMSFVAPSNPGNYTMTVKACYTPGGVAEVCTTNTISYTVVYGCTGTLPTQASPVSAIEQSALSGNIPWIYSTTDTVQKCEFACVAPSTWNGSTCVNTTIPYCTGQIGYQGYVYANDETGLTKNTKYVYSAINTTAKCQFGCPATYPYWTGIACSDTAFSCTGTKAMWSEVYSGDDRGLSVDTPWTHSDVDTGAKCEFQCDSNHEYNATTQKCESLTTFYSCTGTLPANAEQYGNKDTIKLLNDTPWSYSPADTAAKCEYHCSVGFVWDAGSNSCDLSAYDCTGEVPANAQKYINDIFNLTADTPYTYSATDSAAKCEYYCADGYVWDSSIGECIAVSPTLPDLITINVSPEADSPYGIGSQIIFEGTALNASSIPIPEGGFARVEIDWGSDGTFTDYPANGNTQFGAMASGEMRTITYTEINAPAGIHAYRFYVDSSEGLDESNELNNRSSWTTFRVVSGDLTAAPTSVLSGDSTILSWSTQNTCSLTTCTVQGGVDTWGGLSNGGVPSSPLTTPTTYTLSCNGILLDTETITVTTNPPDLSVNKRLVEQGIDVILSWNTNNGDETTCTLTGGTLATNPLLTDGGDVNTGTEQVTVNARTTYTLTCPSGTDSVTVEIVPIGFET